MKYENLRLRKQEIFPTADVLAKELGESYDAYMVFQNSLANVELEQVWQYYSGCSQSWLGRGQYFWTTPRGTNKEKTIYWLSVWDGCFKVTVWFKEKNRWEVLKANVSEKTKRMVRDAKILGKMMTFPIEFEVTDDELLADIFAMIQCKKKLEA